MAVVVRESFTCMLEARAYRPHAMGIIETI